VLAYTWPSTTYVQVRTLVLGPDGKATTMLRSPRNTRLYAVELGAADARPSDSVVLHVQAQLSLGARRLARSTYVLTGRVMPANRGEVVSVYQLTRSGQLLVGQATVGRDGIYWLRHSFVPGRTYVLIATTQSSPSNVGGRSRVRTVAAS
jgi:hypothetical protein